MASAGGSCASGVNVDGLKDGAPINCFGVSSNDPPANSSSTEIIRSLMVVNVPVGYDCKLSELCRIVICADSTPGLYVESWVPVEAHVRVDL